MTSPMIARARRRVLDHDTPFESHVRLYSIRLLRQLGEVANTRDDRMLLAALLLPLAGINAEAEPTSLDAVAAMVSGVPSPVPSGTDPVHGNLHYLASVLRLDVVEFALLELAVVIAHHGALAAVLQRIDARSRSTAVRRLALVLEHDSVAIRRATSASSTLMRLGLLNRFEPHSMLDSVAEMPSDVLLALTEVYPQQSDLMNTFVRTSAPSALQAADFPHLRDDLLWLVRFLRPAIRQRVVGVNVLLYGRTGTGKTEFAKVLTQVLRCQLFEVRHDDHDGAPSDLDGRVRAYQMAQACLGRNGSAIVLFDEVEDVFDGLGLLAFNDRSRGYGKAFMNTMLSDNPVPAIWVTNSVADIDPAYRRRFSYSVRFETPPRQIRRSIASVQFSGLPVAEETLLQLADEDAVSPGQIASAARVTRIANVHASRVAAFVKRSIESSSALLDVGPVLNGRRHSESSIDLSLVNTDVDLAALADRLATKPKLPVSVCLYGPSGSGKTAWAAYLARQLNRPLLSKSIGELLGPYVGETEQNIASMFRQATSENAVLFLDEADGLLAERVSARNSWEITQVNELLVQIEAFSGIFVAATNAVRALDKAAMRRFTLKLSFGYLLPEQRLRLARKLVPDLPEADEVRLAAALRPLPCLTIGDFVTVKQRADLLGVQMSMDDLIRQLNEELRLKDAPARSTIGFTL